MEIYFFNSRNRYIGHRKLNPNEKIPPNATIESVDVKDGQEAYLIDGRWIVSDIKEDDIPYGKHAGIVKHMSFTDRNGIKTVLLDEEIVLNLQSIDGHPNTVSTAGIMFHNLTGFGEIKTSGNASVFNISDYFDIEMINGKKPIKIKSENGLFALIRICLQRDMNYKYIDILYGIQGLEECKDEHGNKNRAHATFYADGNGKFVRMAGYNCVLHNESIYNSCNKEIYPSITKIELLDFNEELIIMYEVDIRNRKVILSGAKFIQK